MTQRQWRRGASMASRTTSRNVWSAAAVIAVASARPSGPSGSLAPSSSTASVNRSRSWVCSALVEHREAGGDIGLERKLVEESGAEGMDGLHFQSTRCLEGAREQSPRQCPPRRIGRLAQLVVDHVVERRVVIRRPYGERVEDALGHIGGGSLGEGDAEDLFRLDALEQEIDHALREHMRLARAGVGGDPGRCFGIGRRPLRPPDLRSGMLSGDLIRRLRCRRSSPPLRDPFLDARKMIVVAVSRAPHRMDERAVGLGVGIETSAIRQFFQGAIGLAVRRAVLESRSACIRRPARRLGASHRSISLTEAPAAMPGKPPLAQHRGFQRELRRQSGAHLLLAAHGAGLVIENDISGRPASRSMRSAMPRRRERAVSFERDFGLAPDLGEDRNDGAAPLGFPAREPMRNA